MVERFRPHIPITVKCLVVLRQLGTLWPDQVLASHSKLLGSMLDRLATLLNCPVADLRLDHEPALRVREFNKRTGRYKPDANDPEFLLYRTSHGHHIKTNVKGDGAQFPDRVLIKRERRRERGPRPKRFIRKIPSRPLKSASRWLTKGTRRMQRRNPK